MLEYMAPCYLVDVSGCLLNVMEFKIDRHVKPLFV